MEKEKELLLKDLCARLPYGVKVQPSGSAFPHKFVGYDKGLARIDTDQKFELKNIKPYLRPISSMTEKEIKELSEIDMKRLIFSSRHLTWHLDGEVIDYLNKKMFDWRGLISKGLALKAPDGMYNIN